MKYTSKFSGEEIDSILDSVASKQDAIPDLETIRNNAKNASDTIARMVESGYLFAGIATIDTNPRIHDAKVFYIANGKGTYTNFGGLEVTEDEVVVLYWDSAWHKVATGIASQAKLSELEEEVNSILGSEEVLEQTLYADTYPQINISRDYKKGENIKFEVLAPEDLNIVMLYEMSADNKVIVQHQIQATSGVIEISENYQGRVRILFPPLSAPTQVSVRVTLIGEINKLDKRVETLESDVETLESNVETLGNKVDSISGSEEIIEQILYADNYPQINISRDYQKGEKIKFEVLTPTDLKIVMLYEMSANNKDVIVEHSIDATSGIMVISENYQGRVRILFPKLTSSTQVSVRLTNDGALKALENNAEALETKVETLESDVETAMQRPPMNSLRIIKRVGCIGDSYTQGHIQLNGQSAELKEEYSWPFFLSQITGNIYSNWGVGGSTAKDWMNSIISVVDKPNNKCQAYIIGLGINDGSSWSPTATQPGDSTDIGTDNDVYIAYYYKIVQRCLSVNPLAKVFCQTMPNGDNNYNAAIRSVVDYCNNNGQNNVILVDLAQDKYAKSEKFYKNPYFISDVSEGHYTAIGYEFMAECLYIILSDIIKNNISEFQNIHQIPYDEIVE